MTTEAAAKHYLAQHISGYADRGYAVFNPHNKQIEELPIIYGFNNGGNKYRLDAQLLAEDGTFLGSHGCSDEAYMYGDLGILEDCRPDRHEDFKKHYPDGYRMDFVPYDDFYSHAKFQEVIELAKKKLEKQK